jgi:hypothetical protein
MHILHMTSAPATNIATNSAAVAATASAVFENLLFSVVRADN